MSTLLICGCVSLGWRDASYNTPRGRSNLRPALPIPRLGCKEDNLPTLSRVGWRRRRKQSAMHVQYSPIANHDQVTSTWSCSTAHFANNRSIIASPKLYIHTNHPSYYNYFWTAPGPPPTSLSPLPTYIVTHTHCMHTHTVYTCNTLRGRRLIFRSKERRRMTSSPTTWPGHESTPVQTVTSLPTSTAWTSTQSTLVRILTEAIPWSNSLFFFLSFFVLPKTRA